MATFRRALTQGGVYFFTVNTYRRQRILTEPSIYAALKIAMQHVKASHPFNIKAFVLLSDYLHCIWHLPAGDVNYALRWSLIKRHVSQAVRSHLTEEGTDSRAKRRGLGLWQRRFWEHQIRDDNDFMRHVDYIHFNPVKHGYVQRVADWPYSTFHRLVESGVYSQNWAGGNEVELAYGD